jgi:RNA 3'-terminal phosphate cyclase (ATP)
VPAETVGDRAARALLKFLDGEGAVDPFLADQLVVPLALAGGGRVSTSQVTAHLETVVDVVTLFSLPARISGRRGGPGTLEVGAG